MLKPIKTALIAGSLMLLSACGFHFQNGQLIPKELQTLSLQSSDPYNGMTVTMRKQLQINNVNVVESQAGVPVLRINKTSTNSAVASVFKQGREAEKILSLEVEASVQMPNQEAYPISAKINRTFFDNSRAALAKSAEKEVIWQDMQEQAARQLISKMVALNHQLKNK